MKRIALTQGKYALVDDEDYERLVQHKWYYNRGYAVRGASPKILMHRVVNETPEGKETDHINMDKLDNRKSNLRTATRKQNAVNRGTQSNNTSGYKGVSWHKGSRKWCAYIIKDKKTKFLGYFKDKKQAALAHDNAALAAFGEFAVLNIPKAGVS